MLFQVRVVRILDFNTKFVIAKFIKHLIAAVGSLHFNTKFVIAKFSVLHTKFGIPLFQYKICYSKILLNSV